ncbi:MAG: zinc-binding alcohol dehydrogenase [Thiotrichales bacterium]
MPIRGDVASNPAFHARAYWVTAPGQAELRDERLRAPGADDVLVRTRYSGISRGTETLVLHGEVPPSEYARMRCPHQAGEFPAPVKYGYINVGVVEQGPTALLGREVFCLHPHQTRYVVPAGDVVPLPEQVPAARAVLAANLETALNGLWDAAPLPGDRIAVIGAGAVGCLVAWLAGSIPGCEVELIDIDPTRARVAARLGLGFALPAQARDDADLVLHTSGNPAGLETALHIAGFEARVIELSWYGTRRVALSLGEAFHARRLTLRSSQVGSIAASQRARWSYRRRLELALRLLAEPRLDGLITGESAFEDLPTVMTRLSGAAAGEICHRIRYD